VTIVTITLNPSLDKTVTINQLCIGELNRVSDVVEDASGKGINITKNCVLWGLDSLALGFIGGYVGNQIQLMLNQENIKTDFVQVKGNTRMNLKVKTSDSHLITEINEPGPEITPVEVGYLLDKIKQHVDGNTVVVISGSAPLSVDVSVYRDIVALSKKLGAWVVLDADKEALCQGLEALPHMIKPNEKEVEWFLDAKQDLSDRQLIDQAKQWIDQGLETVVVSQGPKGAIFASKQGVYKAQGLTVNIASPTGAGDAMVSAMIYAKINNWSFVDACKLSLAASAATVETYGTKPASFEAILEKYSDVNIEEVKQ
jgi:1-phosphofructokinase